MCFFFIFWPIFSLWSSSNFKSLKSCHWKKRYYKKSTTKIYFDQNFVFHFKTGDFPMSWSMFCEVMLIKFETIEGLAMKKINFEKKIFEKKLGPKKMYFLPKNQFFLCQFSLFKKSGFLMSWSMICQMMFIKFKTFEGISDRKIC